MWQAEIGSARLTQAHSFLTRTHLMCDFTLASTEGPQISPGYRGCSNSVVFCAENADRTEQQRLVATLIEHYAEIRDQEAEMLLVLKVPESKGSGSNARLNHLQSRTSRLG
jgi:hypothetical protein